MHLCTWSLISWLYSQVAGRGWGSLEHRIGGRKSHADSYDVPTQLWLAVQLFLMRHLQHLSCCGRSGLSRSSVGFLDVLPTHWVTELGCLPGYRHWNLGEGVGDGEAAGKEGLRFHSTKARQTQNSPEPKHHPLIQPRSLRTCLV